MKPTKTDFEKLNNAAGKWRELQSRLCCVRAELKRPKGAPWWLAVPGVLALFLALPITLVVALQFSPTVWSVVAEWKFVLLAVWLPAGLYLFWMKAEISSLDAERRYLLDCMEGWGSELANAGGRIAHAFLDPEYFENGAGLN